MSYLGNAPARSFISFERQVFSIVNSQTAYALSHSVTNENDIRLVVNNVVQEPGSGKAYTATGTALTLSAALTNGTDEMYCVFLGRATATNAPGAGSVGTVQLADNATTLAKMASGTDGNIISYDASGNPVAVATGNDGQVLTSAGAGAPPVFETPASAANTPAFSAYSSADRAISNTTATLVAANAENFDTDSAYNNSTYKFTPGVAGKYFLYFRYFYTGTFSSTIRAYIYKNGSDVAHNDFTHVQSDNGGMISTIVTSDTDDYFQAYTYQNSGSSRSIVGGSALNEFGGYKLIT